MYLTFGSCHYSNPDLRVAKQFNAQVSLIPEVPLLYCSTETKSLKHKVLKLQRQVVKARLYKNINKPFLLTDAP